MNGCLFYGFLNAKDTKQKRELDNLKNYPFTIIFYEAPKRLEETLKNMLEIFGNRKMFILFENDGYIATFIIPKGATYIINTKGEIVSNKIMYTGRYLKL